MFRTVAPYFIIVSCLMHIFCCGIPLLMSVTSLTTILGVSSLQIFELEWFEAIEDYVLIFVAVLLLVTFAMERLSRNINCLEDGVCEHAPCHGKKLTSSKLLGVAGILYAVNIVTLIFGT